MNKTITRFVWIATGAMLIILGIALFISAGMPQTTLYVGHIGPKGRIYAPEIGAYAPLFQRQTLDGDKLALEKLEGQVVLINFWATWCEPCQYEMPILQDLHQQYAQRGLSIIGVNTGETPAKIEDWVARFKLEFIIVLDNTEPTLADIYRLRGQPSTFILSPTGQISAIFYGPISFTQLEAAIQPLLPNTT